MIEFDELFLSCPPQILFDLPHAKSINFIWVLSMNMNNINYDIGFSKHSLETIELMDGNLMSYYYEATLSFHTRNLGKISFECQYKM